jgi:hypothetical protein
MKSILLGVPRSRRANLWQDAVRACGWPSAEEIAYVDVLSGDVDLAERLDDCRIVRIESPDDDLETNARLLAAGALALEAQGGRPIGDQESRLALAERGRIVHPRQWHLGFQSLMEDVAAALVRSANSSASTPRRRIINDPALAIFLYDKVRCKTAFTASGIPAPPGDKAVDSYDDLRAVMSQAPRGRLMVKLRFGSAAAGATAVEWAGERVRALTTAELVESAEGPRVYVTRRIRTMQSEAETAKLIEAMAPWGLFAEAWLSKDRWSDGRRYDLRVLTIRGEPRHAVARLSRSPFTNLNLLNERADVSALREREWWPKVEDACRRTAVAFPQAFHLGIDVLVAPHGREAFVLEANAFGDLLPGIIHEGMSAYEAEIAALVSEAA